MEQYQELTQKAIDGYESPLMVYIELKKAIDFLSTLQESIKMSAIQEAANEVEPFERFGAKITYVGSAGSRWDFSQIHEWNELKQQREDIESKHKAAFYAWKKGSQYIDENGEVILPAAYKEGNPTIQIKIK